MRQMGSFERAGLRGRRGEPRCRIVKRASMGVRCGIMSAQDCAARSAECAPRGVLRKRIYGYGAEAIPALIQVGKYINTGKTRARRVKSVRQMGSFERAGLRGRRGEPRCRIVKRASMGVRCGIMSAQDCAARSAECAPRRADKIIERNGAL